jgi:beta-glucosidase
MDAGGVSVAPAAENPKFDLKASINELPDARKDESSGSESFEDLGEAQERVHHEEQPTYRSLLQELTLEEKVTLLSGTDFVSSSPVPRLSIPSLKVFPI